MSARRRSPSDNLPASTPTMPPARWRTDGTHHGHRAPRDYHSDRWRPTRAAAADRSTAGGALTTGQFIGLRLATTAALTALGQRGQGHGLRSVARRRQRSARSSVSIAVSNHHGVRRRRRHRHPPAAWCRCDSPRRHRARQARCSPSARKRSRLGAPAGAFGNSAEKVHAQRDGIAASMSSTVTAETARC
jgi:hypothetical protein